MSMQTHLLKTRKERQIQEAGESAKIEAINCVADIMIQTGVSINDLAELTGAAPSFLNRLFDTEGNLTSTSSLQHGLSISLVAAMVEALDYNMYIWIQKKGEDK